MIDALQLLRSAAVTLRRNLLDTDTPLLTNLLPETHANARSTLQTATRLAQLWALAAALVVPLRARARQTKRELWYRLKPLRLFGSPAVVDARLVDLCRMLTLVGGGSACAREALGVIAAPRGSMLGTLSLRLADGSLEPLHADAFAIPGDPIEVLRLRFAQSSARAILVVEKDAVLRRLAEDGLLRRFPCVLLTSCGYPTLTARALLMHIAEQLRLPCFALTDWNPHGLAIMLTYQQGSASRELERYACPSLRWLGLLSDDVRRINDETGGGLRRGLVGFSANDLSTLGSLELRADVAGSASLQSEVAAMRRAGSKLDLEALHVVRPGYLVDYVVAKMVGR